MSKKILIVDDAPFMRTRVKNLLLSQNNYQVIEAENGLQAVEKYKEEKPDLVLMDITMPEMDGITAVKELKKIDPNCKIAMLSAMGQEQLVMEAIKSGAKDFILKPFQPEKVLNTVKKLLG
jgi:two-component system chemotaxis response regulator CheY